MLELFKADFDLQHMMPTRDILSVYDDVLHVSQQMLDAAQRQDWSSLTMLEAVCDRYIQQIQDSSEYAPLTSVELDRKIELLTKILADDRQIRDLLEPWMGRLSTIMRSSL